MNFRRLTFIALAISMGWFAPMGVASADEVADEAMQGELGLADQTLSSPKHHFFSVPEPTVMVFSLIGFIALVRLRRR